LRGAFDWTAGIAIWGDSLTSGSGATSPGRYFPTRFAVLTNRPVFNGGVSGDTSTQIATRLVADAVRKPWPTVIWAGRNNFSSPTTVKADIASMVAALGHTNYIVLSVINKNDPTEYSGQANYTTITTLNSDLAAIYGAHFVDVRSYLVSLYDPGIPQDVTDHGRDVPPTSLSSDGLHLNDAGYQAVANLVYANRAQLGLN
jgi:lysophospholipase L1-like esterase